MNQKIICLATTIFLSCSIFSSVFAQLEAPAEGATTPLSGNAMAASHFENTAVNYYTGMPSISIPLFNWSNQNGLAVGVTLNYSSGGIRVNESPTSAGLGWSVNAGGSIMRIIRGMPDDFPIKGFLYAAPVPLDFVPNGTKYYHDSLDSQQDIFQYNFNGRSGKFFIGKNNQIVTVPLSKLRIGYNTVGDSSITSFYIYTEDGIKYEFNEPEMGRATSIDFDCGFNGHLYTSTWNLSNIVSVFGKDTIKFEYQGSSHTNNVGGSLAAFLYAGSDSIIKYVASQGVNLAVLNKKISKIILPDKKIISFIYDPWVKYDLYDYGLNNIHIRDSVLRYGYQFVFSNSDTTARAFLTGLRYYTKKYISPGYKFYYHEPLFQEFGSAGDSLGNKKDHWGFYNGAENDTNHIPTVSGLYTGASRSPSKTESIASTLSYIEDPSGGKTFYKFENNDAYRTYTFVPQYSRFNAIDTSTNEIHVRHVTNNSDSFTLIPQMVHLIGDNIPFSEESSFIWTITNADSSVIYATDTVSLTSLFSLHIPFTFSLSNLQNGDYIFKTKLANDAIVNCRALWVELKWTNQEPFDSLRFMVGGLRIKQITHLDPITGKTDVISTYKYVLPNGRSSGFLGDPPSYIHPYRETKIVGSAVYDYSYETISANPINNLNFTQGSSVGYSRVEVIKGTLTNNLGKEVYEFTNLNDANLQWHPQIFPYAPYLQEDWLLGLNKKVSVYDSSGRLMQETVNTYQSITQNFNDSNFRSVKLGLVSTLIDGDDRKETYDGEYYYPKSGRADLISSTQTFYHTDNSQQVKTQQVQYDTNFNALKMISGYDQSRGLFLERRMYYPYNYTIGGTIGKLRDSSIYSVVSTEDWITGDSNPRMLSASATDFQELPNGNIKPLAVYSLQSKAPLPFATIDTFDANHLIRNNTYFKKQQEFISYDSLGNCLEVRNTVSGKSNVVIMDYNDRLPIAKISNAGINNVAYTSFESNGKGNWNITSDQRVGSNAITGSKSYDLSNGNITKAGLNNAITYIITFWKINSASVSVSGGTNTTLISEHKGWKLYTQTISSTDNVIISGTGLIDELRLYPRDADMATTTYVPVIGVTSTCDANNTISYYEYDSLNRVRSLRDMDGNILKKYEYTDDLIERNLSSYAVVHLDEVRMDTTTGVYRRYCVAYPFYSSGLIGDAIGVADLSHCPRNQEAGEGLVPDE